MQLRSRIRAWMRRHYGFFGAVRGLLLLGRRRRCPLCGWPARRFLPYRPFDGPPVPDEICPRCGAGRRQRALWLLLKKRGLLQEGTQVLHIAPEPGLSRALASAPSLQIVTMDLEDPLAAVRADLTRLPFRDGSFHLLLCSHVLEHIPDDLAAMGEIRRVLTPAGVAAIQVPTDPSRAETREDASLTTPEERTAAFGQPDHVRIYGRDFVPRLRSAGLRVETVVPEEFVTDRQREVAVPGEEALHLCRRACGEQS